MAGYREAEVVNAITEALKSIDKLYQSKCVNWKGLTSDTNKYYTEIISSIICSNLHLLYEIKQVDRKSNYLIKDHKVISFNKGSNRNEELLAKNTQNKDLGDLGISIDYQVPLKDKQANKGVGKIDLITCDSKSNTLNLVELKAGNNKETLLRAVLEIATYSQILNKENFLKEYVPYVNGKRDQYVLKKAVLITSGCNAYTEALELTERLKLKELIKALKVGVYELTITSKGKYSTKRISC